MRLITIDNGNSNPHVGIFENNKLQSIVPLSEYKQLPDDYILISDVGGNLSIKPSFDLKSKRLDDHFFDMPVHYAKTLGDDRLFLAYGLFKKIKSDERILAIDAGTFITADLITEQGFMGGCIFLGVNTYLNAYSKGSKLPIVENKELNMREMAHTTEDAILMARDIYLESILKEVILKMAPTKIHVTGGSLELVVQKCLKLNLKDQLESDPHSIHSAMAMIYQTHLP